MAKFSETGKLSGFLDEVFRNGKSLLFPLGRGDGKAVSSVFERGATVFFAEQFIKVSAVDVSDVAGYAHDGAVGGH